MKSLIKILLIGTALLEATSAVAAPCDTLKALPLRNTTITAVESLPAGAFTPPGATAPLELPAFCRVAATLRPSSDSDIKIEVWLPASNWNGIFQPVGNGLWTGNINFGAMAGMLRSGFATAGTDTGHQGNNATFALGHPEKMKDFAYRSFHEMTVTAKSFIAAYYGSGPKYSYLNQCGGGSRQALIEAQMFPDDFDAIAVGGLDTQTSRHTFGQMWVYQATHKDEASYIPPEKYPLIFRAALETCDAQADGVKDGVIDNPGSCRFDPGILECKAGDAATCLTSPQVEAARKIYTSPTNPRTKEEIFSPFYPGSERGWGSQAGSAPFPYAVEYFKYVFKDPNWDYRTRPVNFDRDFVLAQRPENRIANADNPDVSKFLARGGKLLLYGGWADTGIAPRVNVDYYNSVLKKLGDTPKVRDAVRLFMVPNMGHCIGTNGADAYDFDSFGILKEWHQTGKTPDQIIATHYQNGKAVDKRLLCPYPQIAVYKGNGSAGDPSNFTCQAPK
jgi:feruloyl esterase